MIQCGRLTIQEVFEVVPIEWCKYPVYHEFIGERVRVSSDRLRNFKVNGVKCVTCGIEGTIFISERNHQRDVSPHLNLYAETDAGLILMTRDHIIPKSKGGKNVFSNLQPMCTSCNCKKGSTVEGEDGNTHRT